MRQGQLLQLRPLARVEELSDAALAAACATGDRAAQGLLFERHAEAVHRFVARMRGANADAVDDLVQATFVAAFRGAGAFRGPKLRSWLFGIATNVLRRHIRTEVARHRTHASYCSQPVDDHAHLPDVDVRKLRAAIDGLSVKLREVLVLVDLEGERGIDVAAALDIPEGTVWRRLSVARAQLRAMLEADA